MDDQLVMTIDLGSSATKAVLWSPGAGGDRPRPGHDADARAGPGRAGSGRVVDVERLRVQAAPRRGTAAGRGGGLLDPAGGLVPVAASGEPIGAAIARGDRRAVEQADRLGDEFEVLTGVVPDAACAAAGSPGCGSTSRIGSPRPGGSSRPATWSCCG
ncbi:MAG: hypothetical protein U0V56_08565 [Actinomycetota bacterium]